ncbi:MAG: hypothetical protein BGO05_20020 [Rhizobiales bacterium 63-7]|nr:MAG: hypothetical protein BGO05_20020 [Rhizobiales bacterium 63-7]
MRLGHFMSQAGAREIHARSAALMSIVVQAPTHRQSLRQGQCLSHAKAAELWSGPPFLQFLASVG